MINYNLFYYNTPPWTNPRHHYYWPSEPKYLTANQSQVRLQRNLYLYSFVINESLNQRSSSFSCWFFCICYLQNLLKLRILLSTIGMWDLIGSPVSHLSTRLVRIVETAYFGIDDWNCELDVCELAIRLFIIHFCYLSVSFYSFANHCWWKYFKRIIIEH